MTALTQAPRPASGFRPGGGGERGGVRVLPLRPRSALVLLAVSVLGLMAFCWPLLVRHAGTAPDASHASDAPYLFALLLALLAVVVVAEVTGGGMDAKAVALLGVLAAFGAPLRLVGGGSTGFTLLFFLLIPAGRVLGPGFGFVLGSLTMFASALITAGVGPWLPFQMIGAGWVGLGAGLLPRRLHGRAEIAALALYGSLAGLLYGLLLNLWFWPYATYATTASYVAGAPLTTNLAHFLAFDLATSLGYDVPRALGNLILVAVLGRPVVAALRRAARRAAFDAPVSFEPPAQVP